MNPNTLFPRRTFGAAILAIALALTVPMAFAQKQKAPVDPIFAGKDGVALSGYDPVAYFTVSKPVSGKPTFQTKWNGATWQFSSAANRDLFVASPEKYAPQFGGYCAYAVSEGYTAPADPTAWKIVDGKLYVNYNADVQKKWAQMEKQRIMKGQMNWPKLHK